jgi:micrococcal nuclease
MFGTLLAALGLATPPAVEGYTICCPDETVYVTQVEDGDTFRIKRASGSRDKVRFIGIDTPERGRCYFQEARAFTDQRIEHRSVLLHFGSRLRDDSGRLLAYPMLDGINLSVELAQLGYARSVAASFPQDAFEFAVEIEAAEADARVNLRGLWGACAPGTAFP